MGLPLSDKSSGARCGYVSAPLVMTGRDFQTLPAEAAPSTLGPWKQFGKEGSARLPCG